VNDLVAAMRTLMGSSGRGTTEASRLTPREREVLAMVVSGCANGEIAERIKVSQETVKHHLTRIYDKVGVTNRLELALAATQKGLVLDV
jgi:DNA-binding NarL/FixJ family response regulator